MKLVNIKNKGMIPWIKKNGPLFGYMISDGLYSILSKDIRIIMERTTPELAAKAKAEYEKTLVVETKEEPIAVEVEDEPLKTEDIVEEIKIEETEPLSETIEESISFKQQLPEDEIEVAIEVAEAENALENEADLDAEIDSAIEGNESVKKDVLKEESDEKDALSFEKRYYTDEELSKYNMNNLTKLVKVFLPKTVWHLKRAEYLEILHTIFKELYPEQFE